jgi:AcrR family transcriptional regulator
MTFMPVPQGRRSGRPTKEQSRLMTEAILRAATASFAEHGFAGTTIHNLSAEIGIMRRGLLQRFATKENLLIAVATRDTTSYAADLGLLPLRDRSFEADFRRICLKLWERGSDPREAALLRAYFGEMGRLPELADVIRHFYLSIAETLEGKIAEAQRSGWFASYEAFAVADCAISMIISTPRIRTMVLDRTMIDPISGEEHFGRLWAFMWRMAVESRETR